MLRRQRPGGGRHPPPLTPTVSNFKPRAQWNNSGSSILLYVNLPGFYRDQIEIKKDEKTRAIHIQGQRPLSTQTKARFNEVYRVPESCDMTKLNTSFSHGLLTIEFPAVVEGEKTEKAGNDQGKTVQRLDNEENRGSSLGLKKPSDKEKQVGSSQEKAVTMASKEEPKTYKSVVEGKRSVPAANQKKVASPNLGRKEKETVVEKKEAAQQKTAKEEEARSASAVGGSLKAKEGITRTPTIGGSLEPKVHSKEETMERKGDGEIGGKLKEERKIGFGENKEKNPTKPTAGGGEARGTNKEIYATNHAKPELKSTKERVERITHDVNGNVISKHDKRIVGYKVSEGGIQERVEEKKVEEAGLVMEPRRVDSDVKEDLTKGSEDKEKMVEKSTLLVEEQRKTIIDTSLVNVGVASLVIMGFGAYVFVPLVKMFY